MSRICLRKLLRTLLRTIKKDLPWLLLWESKKQLKKTRKGAAHLRAAVNHLLKRVMSSKRLIKLSIMIRMDLKHKREMVEGGASSLTMSTCKNKKLTSSIKTKDKRKISFERRSKRSSKRSSKQRLFLFKRSLRCRLMLRRWKMR